MEKTPKRKDFEPGLIGKRRWCQSMSMYWGIKANEAKQAIEIKATALRIEADQLEKGEEDGTDDATDDQPGD